MLKASASGHAHRRATARTRARAGAAAGMAAALVLVLRVTDLLTGPAALIVATVLVLAVPTSRQLSRRILLAGMLLCGWLPVLWWWAVPTAGLGRVTALLAATAAGLAMWVAHAEHPGQRLRRLVPRVSAVDALPFLAAGSAALVLRGWWRLRSGESVLAFLSSGWDNSAHFDMVRMIREHGVTIDALAAPAGTSWKFADYPQSFHVLVAAVMELTGPLAPVAAGPELVAYLHSVGVVAVAGVAVLSAGLCALPALRRRPLLAAPLTVLVVAGCVLGPGSVALHDGFPNFFLACVLASAAVLLAAPWRRYVPTVQLAALGGALVAVTHTWILLGSLLAPVAVCALALLVRGRGRSRGKSLRDAVILAATLVAMARAVTILRQLQATTVLTTPGAIVMPDLRVVLALAALAATCWAVLGTRRVGRIPAGGRANAWWLAGIPVTGMVTTAAIAAAQLRSGAGLTYYFWKYATGLELVAIVVLAAGLACAARPRRPGPRAAPVLVSATACLVATQAFGWFGPGLAQLGTAAPGAVRYVQITREPGGSLVTARNILDAGARQRAHPDVPLVVLEAGPAGINPVSAQQWLLALTGGWTGTTNDQASDLLRAADTLPELTASAERVLHADPSTHLVVSGPDAEALVASVPDAARATG